MLGIRRRKQKKKKHQPKEKKHLAISHKMDKPLISMLEMFTQPPSLKQAKKATKTMATSAANDARSKVGDGWA